MTETASRKRDERRQYEVSSHLNRIAPATNVVFNLILLMFALICIVPVIFVFIISISSEKSLAQIGYSFIPKEFSLSAYKFLWNEKNTILHALWISVLVTVLGTSIGVALTTMMGYVLSRPVYKLKNFFTWVVFIPMIFFGLSTELSLAIGCVLCIICYMPYTYKNAKQDDYYT